MKENKKDSALTKVLRIGVKTTVVTWCTSAAVALVGTLTEIVIGVLKDKKEE